MGTLVFQATLGGAINLIGPNTASTVNFTLPSADGSSGQALTTNGSGTLAFGTLAVGAGGTGLTSTPANGALDIGNGTGFTRTTLTAGSNITITNGAGSITIAASGGGASAATPTALGTVYGKTDTSNLAFFGYQAGFTNSTGTETTAIGTQALYNMTAGPCTAVGYRAGYSVTTGDGNTFIGRYSGGNSAGSITGATNTGVGNRALQVLTSGGNNVAVGSGSMPANTTGNANVAVGLESLYSNTTGSNGTAVGYQALYTNTTSSGNTAVGYQAAANGTGDGTTALGYRAGYNLTTGYGNTSVGWGSMFSGTSIRHSTGIGYEALKNATTGVGNTMIQPYGSSETYLPAYNITTESNRISMGSTQVSNAYIQVAWTAVSDARDKTNFAPVTHGLDFVNQLNPISYQFKETRESDVPHGPVRYGFKAQEVLELEGANPVIVDNEDSEKLRITDTYLIPILVKAIQELKAEFDAYKALHP